MKHFSDPHWKTLQQAADFHGKPERTILRWVSKYQIATKYLPDGRAIYAREELEAAEHKSKHKGKEPEWARK